MKKLVLLLLIAVFIVGCGSNKVVIKDSKFIPSSLEVKIGDKVEWVNKDLVNHSVTFEDVRLDKVLLKGEKVSYTFKEKGEARYFCKFHSGMKGSVTVK